MDDSAPPPVTLPELQAALTRALNARDAHLLTYDSNDAIGAFNAGALELLRILTPDRCPLPPGWDDGHPISYGRAVHPENLTLPCDFCTGFAHYGMCDGLREHHAALAARHASAPKGTPPPPRPNPLVRSG